MRVSKYAVYREARALIAGISIAAGYHHDMAGRVLLVMHLPEHGGLEVAGVAGPVPYACIVMRDNGPYEPTGEGPIYLRKFPLFIYGFVGETSNDRLTSTELEQLANLEDDIFVAFALNARQSAPGTALNGACVSCEPVNGHPEAGWPIDHKGDPMPAPRRYGELEMIYEVTQLVSYDLLMAG